MSWTGTEPDQPRTMCPGLTFWVCCDFLLLCVFLASWDPLYKNYLESVWTVLNVDWWSEFINWRIVNLKIFRHIIKRHLIEITEKPYRHDFGPGLVPGSSIFRNGYKLINVVFPFWYFQTSVMLQDNKMTKMCPIYPISENKSENASVLKFWMTIFFP